MLIKIKKEKIKAVLWGIITFLFLLVLQAIFFGGFESSSTSNLGANAGQAASAYSGMVGGC